MEPHAPLLPTRQVPHVSCLERQRFALVVVLLVLVQASFAGNSIVAKLSFDQGLVDAIIFSLFRDVGASMVLLVGCRIADGAWGVPRKVHLIHFVGIGVLGVVVGQMFMVIALEFTSPFNCMVLQPSQPVLAVLLGALLGIEPLQLDKCHGLLSVCGILLSVAGATIAVVYGSTANSSRGDGGGDHVSRHDLLIGNSLLAIQCVAGALYQLLQKRVLSLDQGRYSSIAVAAWGYTFGAVGVMCVIPLSGRLQLSYWQIPRLGWLAVAYAILLTSAFNYAAQAYANRHSSPILVTAFFPLQVVFTAVFSFLAFSECPSLMDVVGGVNVLGGLALVIAARQLRKQRASTLPWAAEACARDEHAHGASVGAHVAANPPTACCLGAGCTAEEVRAAIEQEGMVVIRNFLSAAEAAEALRRVEALAERLPSLVASGVVPAAQVQHDDVARHSTLKQIQQLAAHEPYFGTLRRQLEPMAMAALAERVEYRNMQFFNKPPTRLYGPGKTSQATPPHQDAYYFMIEPPHQAVTAWMALDPVDEENGCLRYVRGSAAGGVRTHDYSGVVGFSQSLTAESFGAADTGAEFAVCAAPGDLILHVGTMIHRAEPNRSETRHRRAIGAIFYGESARVDEAKHTAKQREIYERAQFLEGQERSS